MSEWQLKTPVAFIIFNRPDTTELVFAEIAKAKPPMLLVVADGPRANRVGEAGKCAATRAIIERVNWDCEVLTNYSGINLGCKNRVASGLGWVFEQVPEAIVLEDDCLPEPSFFRFCEEMLERYRDDERIGMISGDNFQFGKVRNSDSYYFSKYVHIWGWATWRDRWQKNYDASINKWPGIREGDWLKDMGGSKKETAYWSRIFEATFKSEIDTWDYQWVFANWIANRFNIMPNVNLISNIGFNANATHTFGSSIFSDMAVEPMSFPIKHPKKISMNRDADIFTDRIMFSGPNGGVKRVIKSIIKFAIPKSLVIYLRSIQIFRRQRDKA